MTSCRGASLLLRLLAVVSVLWPGRGWTITLPSTVTAVEGTCAVVPCHTQPHQRVIWYQYRNINYPVVSDELRPHKVEQQFRGRTRVPGRAAEGNCTLLLDGVRRDENLLQLYVWINPESKPSQKFYHQTVTIHVERSDPMMTVEEQILEGSEFQADCSIKYSCPSSPPSLHWSLSGKDSTFTESTVRLSDQWLYRKTLRGVATYEMHNQPIRCTAQFGSFSSQTQRTLNILYKPVDVMAVQEAETVAEGGSVSVTCAANSNPKPHTYSWFRRRRSQKEKMSSTEQSVTLDNSTRDTSVSCVAQNQAGASRSAWTRLDVQYAPLILPEASCSRTQAVLRCVCRAEASPHASISWRVEGNASLSSSFSSTQTTPLVTGQIGVPAGGVTAVWCTAVNSRGNDTRRLPAGRPSGPSSSLFLLVFVGIAFLLGCAALMWRKRTRGRNGVFFHYFARSQSSSKDVRDEGADNDHQRSQNSSVEEEERYSHPQRPPAERARCGLATAKSAPEDERLSAVYANDFVPRIRTNPPKPKDPRIQQRS